MTGLLACTFDRPKLQAISVGRALAHYGIDPIGFCALPDLDWAYIEGCAAECELWARLEAFRGE